MNHTIIGYGQVGKAIQANCIGVCNAFDKKEWEHLHPDTTEKTDILHICIPYCDNFHTIADAAAIIFRPSVLIVHSTVKPGTTKQIQFDRKLYSPVNGRHGDGFDKNIRLYKKIFAGDVAAYSTIADCFTFDHIYIGGNTDELEFSKISCTNYMYWLLAYQHIIHGECERRGYQFENVYTMWNTLYNDGIKNVHPEWMRPVYEYQEGFPGGHCLRPNIHLDNNEISRFLRSYETIHCADYPLEIT